MTISYVMGLDLGQSIDFTGVALLERERVVTQKRITSTWRPTTVVEEEQPPLLTCTYLRRFPIGESYVAIVAEVVRMLANPQIPGCTLVVDGTGVGRGIVDMFRAKLPNLIPVSIHGGDEALRDKAGYHHVPKRDLVGQLVAAAQSQRLKVVPGMAESETLTTELLNFRVSISATGHDSYSHRDGEHDDLLLALALATWWAHYKMRLKIGMW